MSNRSPDLQDYFTKGNTIYRPQIVTGSEKELREETENIIRKHKPVIIDTYEAQLAELIRASNPAQTFNPEEIREKVEEHLTVKPGNWIYYPWNNRLIHLLAADDFVYLRTNRNRLKITEAEQESLQQKTIGIIGMSVGQSVALTVAMERACGRLKLADFDDLDLSNLNRIRTGVHNLGLLKTVIAAREIAELDPYLEVELYNQGINTGNIESFLDKGKTVDLLVEVCDSLPVKVAARIAARKRKIPVVMDTNDRGMIDIERFDLEPERPLFHGLVDESVLLQTDSTNREAVIPVLMKLISFENASARLKESMNAIGISLLTWPQLASSVVYGGGITCDVSRRILLGLPVKSGRYYMDPETAIP